MSDILERLYAVPETGADPELIEAAAGYIEEIQSELNEQARLLGMSAEREMALNTQIQKLISERNAFGLAIDRAISGIVPDEHPLRSRLVEIAAMRAEIDAMKRQKPVLLWHVTDNEDEEDIFPVTEHNLQCHACRPLYLAPGAQTAPSVPDGWQPIETAPKDGTHVLLANKTGTRVADGMYGNYKVWSWPYVLVEPAYWRPMPAAPSTQENNDGRN